MIFFHSILQRCQITTVGSINVKKVQKLDNSQWEFSSQKRMKIRHLAKAGFELGTPEFPQQDVLTIEPLS